MGASSISSNRDNLVVPTNALAEWLEPRLQSLEARYDDVGNQGRGTDEAKAGPFASLYQTVGDRTATQYDSVPRRLFSILKRETFTVAHEIADAFADALDSNATMAELPVFPGNHASAVEMVEVNLDMNGEEMTEMEVERLARSLQNFTRGYIRFSADKKTKRYVREQVRRRRTRVRNRRKRELVAA